MQIHRPEALHGCLLSIVLKKTSAETERTKGMPPVKFLQISHKIYFCAFMLDQLCWDWSLLKKTVGMTFCVTRSHGPCPNHASRHCVRAKLVQHVYKGYTHAIRESMRAVAFL